MQGMCVCVCQLKLPFMLSAAIRHLAEDPTQNDLVRIQRQDKCNCQYLEHFSVDKSELN